ncbi:MAG: acyl-CoA dehydrogenase family protein, partial [Alphaproteobacteria bacterium]|nr:acyl-CoA dehydrogenase family protein [Alphaproteobacteria bacterium]
MSTSPLAHAHDMDAFRAALRDWFPRVIPANWRDTIRMQGESGYAQVQADWYRALADAGLATAHWPAGWGGADLPLAAQIVYYEEMIRADAPLLPLHQISLYHMPATLFAHGTAAQRARYLDGARLHGDIWCQGFSEPGAGSDLASLRTSAVRDDDHYVLNGQKTWSTNGAYARYCLLLARTDTQAPRKQAGISCFVVDLKETPGVTVRPIRQITGEADFAEIFFDDARIRCENLIGAENDGWQIAQSTLTSERGLLIFEHTERLAAAYWRDAKAGKDKWLRDPAHAREFACFFPRVRSVQLMARALLEELAKDPHGGFETATFLKLAWAPLLQEYTGFVARMGGLEAQQMREPLRCGGHTSGDAMTDFMASYGWTV